MFCRLSHDRFIKLIRPKNCKFTNNNFVKIELNTYNLFKHEYETKRKLNILKTGLFNSVKTECTLLKLYHYVEPNYRNFINFESNSAFIGSELEYTNYVDNVLLNITTLQNHEFFTINSNKSLIKYLYSNYGMGDKFNIKPNFTMNLADLILLKNYYKKHTVKYGIIKDIEEYIKIYENLNIDINLYRTLCN